MLFLLTILPFMITIICYHYTKNRSNITTEKILTTNFFDSRMMLRFDETKVPKNIFMLQNKNVSQ